MLPFLELCHPLVVFGSLLGLLAALLLEVEVGHDRFGGSYRRSELGDGVALLFAVVESGVEAGGGRLCLGLAGLALVQPGLVVVVDGEGGYLFVDFVDAGDVGGPFPATPRRYG